MLKGDLGRYVEIVGTQPPANRTLRYHFADGDHDVGGLRLVATPDADAADEPLPDQLAAVVRSSRPDHGPVRPVSTYLQIKRRLDAAGAIDLGTPPRRSALGSGRHAYAQGAADALRPLGLPASEMTTLLVGIGLSETEAGEAVAVAMKSGPTEPNVRGESLDREHARAIEAAKMAADIEAARVKDLQRMVTIEASPELLIAIVPRVGTLPHPLDTIHDGGGILDARGEEIFVYRSPLPYALPASRDRLGFVPDGTTFRVTKAQLARLGDRGGLNVVGTMVTDVLDLFGSDAEVETAALDLTSKEGRDALACLVEDLERVPQEARTLPGLARFLVSAGVRGHGLSVAVAVRAVRDAGFVIDNASAEDMATKLNARGYFEPLALRRSPAPGVLGKIAISLGFDPWLKKLRDEVKGDQPVTNERAFEILNESSTPANDKRLFNVMAQLGFRKQVTSLPDGRGRAFVCDAKDVEKK